MNGQCKCGGIIRERNHEIKTDSSLDKWGVNCKLPATVEQSTCGSCGRYGLRIFDADKSLVLDRL